MQPNTTLHDSMLSHNATMAFDQGLQISASLGTYVWDPIYQDKVKVRPYSICWNMASFMSLFKDSVAEE